MSSSSGDYNPSLTAAHLCLTSMKTLATDMLSLSNRMCTTSAREGDASDWYEKDVKFRELAANFALLDQSTWTQEDLADVKSKGEEVQRKFTASTFAVRQLVIPEEER